jgi:hypothetical protein
MTDREINKTIAKHLRWKSSVKQWFCSKDGGESGWLFDEYKEKCEEYLNNIKETDWRYGSTIHPSMSLPPKYCEDLNLMHEAEKALDYEQADDFWDFLCDTTSQDNDERENPLPWRFARTHATARQRAEAFLKTVGKWKEND